MQAPSGERELLDVNPEENELLKCFYEFCGDDVKLNLNPNEIPPKVKSIKPTAGFCVKAKDKMNCKIFINICHCEDLPKPPDITEAELMEILSSDEPSSYRVPMSLGEPHKEKDKSGKDCTCYDVIINSEYFESIRNNELFRRFLITLSYEGIQDKYYLNIDADSCIILRNKNYHGTMPDHHIRCKPLIAELGSAPYIKKSAEKENSSEPLLKSNVTTPPKTVPSNFVLRKIPAKGYPAKLIFEITIPNIISSETVSLFVGEDRIVFHEIKFDGHVDIFLPHLIVQEKCVAEFDICKKVLTLTMPVVPESNMGTS